MSNAQHHDEDTVKHLERMANDIGNFFASETNREDAIKGISNHIRSYWTPKMRQRIFDDLARGGGELNELPRAAIERLMKAPAAKPDQPPGGDAG
ncbi:MAG TPA: formate dehydrogenase subunit delta [Steroidobacteraceae bacterium]|jgi:formate dehydrogenase subunit delta|nr:formate dehydrogenase subunit delta [Steroidobacteraceae bacterium]